MLEGVYFHIHEIKTKSKKNGALITVKRVRERTIDPLTSRAVHRSFIYGSPFLLHGSEQKWHQKVRRKSALKLKRMKVLRQQ